MWKKIELVSLWILVLGVFALMICIGEGVQIESKEFDKCAAAGGVYVNLKSKTICIDKKVIIPLTGD